MFCGLGEEERARIRKKKKKKTSSQPKVGWLGQKGSLRHIMCEIFLAVLEQFFNETDFYAKLAGWF